MWGSKIPPRKIAAQNDASVSVKATLPNDFCVKQVLHWRKMLRISLHFINMHWNLNKNKHWKMHLHAVFCSQISNVCARVNSARWAKILHKALQFETIAAPLFIFPLLYKTKDKTDFCIKKSGQPVHKTSFIAVFSTYSSCF